MATSSRLKKFLVLLLVLVGAAIALAWPSSCICDFPGIRRPGDDLEGDDLYHRAAAAGRLSRLHRGARTIAASKGVTPENNAVVPFFQGDGPRHGR